MTTICKDCGVQGKGVHHCEEYHACKARSGTVDDFHPDDMEAHRIIKRVCGIPSDASLSNARALRHLFKYIQSDLPAMTEKEDAFLRGWIGL